MINVYKRDVSQVFLTHSSVITNDDYWREKWSKKLFAVIQHFHNFIRLMLRPVDTLITVYPMKSHTNTEYKSLCEQSPEHSRP